MKYLLIATVVAVLALVAFWLWTPDRSRAALEAKYLESPDDMLDVKGVNDGPAVRLHVRDRGPKDAPAVLLLHGFGSSLQTWDAWARALARDHRVIALDLPGSGLSPPDPSGDYRDTRTVALLNALLDTLKVQRTSLVGNSIGGRMAWRFAAAHPDRVDKLVLVSPDGFASPGFEYGKAPEVPAVMRLMRYVMPMVLVRQSLAPAYSDPSALTDERLVRYDDLLRAPGGRDALLARMAQTVLVDPAPLLRRIEAPTLLVWGNRDALIPIANAGEYLRALPHARLFTLDGVGHLPQEEAADRSLAEIAAFLGPSKS
ncbi:alpha/beta fold hydrolase [soil metagenome]